MGGEFSITATGDYWITADNPQPEVADEFRDEGGFLAGHGHQGHRLPGAGQCHVEEPALFGKLGVFAAWHRQLQDGIVGNRSGHLPCHHMAGQNSSPENLFDIKTR